MTSVHTVFMLLYSHMPLRKVGGKPPTVLQARAIKYIQEGKAASKAMILAGYSPVSARNPATITQSDAYKAVMANCGITEEYLSKRHKQLVDSKKEDISLRAVDLAYKVTGKYQEAEKKTNSTPIFIQINPPQ